MRKSNFLLSGLFSYKKRYWYKNIKSIWIMLERIVYVIKHGYYPQATYETFNYFIDMYRDILSNYIISPDSDSFSHEGMTKDEWNNLINTMLKLLDEMDADNPVYYDLEYDEAINRMNASKHKFFELFEKYFYFLWD